MKKALLIVDVQNDFCPGGALGIKGGDKVIPAINKYIKIFVSKKLPVFATRDWHPKKTRHFKEFGGMWPVHCIRNTNGAMFHPKLRLPKAVTLLYKGMDHEEDSYSVFQARDEKGVVLLDLLKAQGIGEIYIAGLATDYCVRFSTQDALKKGFEVKILADAIKGVDLKPGDSREALREMVRLGAKKITLRSVLITDEKQTR